MKVILNKNKIPAIWFWTWHIDSEDIIFEAIQAGYRHIDTAQMYKNEETVWNAINTAISKGILSSYEDIFVTSKLWVSKFDKWTMKSNDILNSIYTSRERINQDYIDLMLIHWPTYHDIKIVLDGMIDAKVRGIIKHIWVSNFNIQQLEEANSYLQKEYNEQISCNQIELNLYYENNDIISYCHKNNILISAYSPLCSRAEYHLSEMPYIWKDPKIIEIWKKYGKSPHQIVLKYLSQKWNIAILPSSKTKKYIIDNLNINDFSLNKEDIEILNAYPKNMSVIYEKYKDLIYKS